MIFPNSNLPNDAQPWGREVQKRVEGIEATVKSNDINNTARDRQLAASVARIDKTVTDLAYTQSIVNNATGDLTAINDALTTINTEISSLNTQVNNNLVNGTMTLAYVGADSAKTNVQVATVTFTKPTWATKVTVSCTGSVNAVTADNTLNPVSGTMTVQINGVKAQYANSISDPTLSGTVVNKSISTTANDTPTEASLSFSRSFTTSGSVTVDVLVTKTANTLTTASYIANLVASAYWSE